MNIFIRWIINAVILLFIAYLMPGITISSFYIALILVVVLGLINTFIKPVLLILTLPINILTLGLLTFVINAFLFWLASTFVKGFEVTSFWGALFGALLFSLLTSLINNISNKKEHSKNN